jgi:molybdopterin molybdotransferase
MLSVSGARERLLAALRTVGAEQIALGEAAGRVLALPLLARDDSPRFDNSSMDGFAVCAADLNGVGGAKPKTLKVVGDIPAGAFADLTLNAGQAMRIMTGAAMPKGADAVVPVEDTDAPVAQPGAALPATVEVRKSLKAGDYVRPAGQDFRAGDELLAAGRRVRPADLALLAQQGRANLQVYRKPRVAVFSSGDELLKVEEPFAPGKIRETNSYMLAALVEHAGAEAMPLGIARDTLADAQAHLDRAVDLGADLILSSAGVSVGAFDYLRQAVTSRGELDFWKVNMRPGRPFTFGQYRDTPFVGLPGNPASAYVGFEVFVRPALQKMGGLLNWTRVSVQAELAEAIESDGRESYLRVLLDRSNEKTRVYLTGHQGSGNLFSLVQAHALMIVPAGVSKISAGSMVEIWPL